MRIKELARRLTLDQRDLGPLLRFESLVPLTLLLWIVGGSLLTLPPGPLCDEGMVLFMEGGCDWGASNVFFYAKASLLLTVHLALLAAWRRSPRSWRGFLPHLALLALLGITNRSGGSCDTYYGHPNGSLGQMVLELACVAVAGIALARAMPRARWIARLLALLAWNALHVGLFYLYLELFPHWSWWHTVALGGTMLVVAGLLWRARPHPAPTRREPTGRPGRAARTSAPLTRRQTVSLSFIAAAFALLTIPFELTLVLVICGYIGLVTSWLASLLMTNARARAVAALVALALPAIGLQGVSAGYHEQKGYADRVLADTGTWSPDDAAILRAAALAARRGDGTYEPVDLIDSPGVRTIGERMLGSSPLRTGATLSLLVPLDEEAYVRLQRGWSWGPSGDVLERLVSEHGYLEGHELIWTLRATGRSQPLSWTRYMAESALRWHPPAFHSGRVLADGAGGVGALLVVDTKPLG